MKTSFSVAMGLFVLALGLLFGAIAADAQWRSKTHDVYEALTGVTITIDGNVADWKGVLETVKGTDGTPFTGVKFISGSTGEEVVFEEYGGGTWDGPQDHELSIMMVWEPAAFYIGLVVTDDEHENAANSGWNGDAFQAAFEMTGKRPAGGVEALLLYDVALGGNGQIVIENEKPAGAGLGASDVAIVRNEGAKKTYYEVKFPAQALGVGNFAAGQEFGLGVCVNDGDLAAGQGGQKGWSGWYAASIVFGKESENTGLVRLSSGTPAAVEPTGKLATTWGEMKKR